MNIKHLTWNVSPKPFTCTTLVQISVGTIYSIFQHTSLVLVLGIFSWWAVRDFWAEPLVMILKKIRTIPVQVYQKKKKPWFWFLKKLNFGFSFENQTQFWSGSA
jgi:hypothetical protein